MKLARQEKKDSSATKPDDTFAVVKAAAEETHAHGVRLAVHATELATARAAVEAGADVLVHSVGDLPVTDDFAQTLKDRHIIYTTTIVVLEGYAKVLSRQATLMDIDRTCGDPKVIASWDDLKSMPEDPSVGQRAARVKASIAVQQANLKKVEDAGVIVAAGTDAGNIGTLHGPDLHREFELMSDAGLTPMQILVAATHNAALVFSTKPEFGTLEAGKLADITILDADPLADIRNARKIHTVIRGGAIYAESELVNGASAH
jgi:imidazolonepropionase-like amidohydrolase